MICEERPRFHRCSATSAGWFAVAELPNHYGTGHGRPIDQGGLGPRHARLALGAASTLAAFSSKPSNSHLDSHHAPDRWLEQQGRAP